MFLPPYDTGATLRAPRRARAAGATRARIVSLGDSFHDCGGYGRLAEADRARLAALQRGREWIWISGNHDHDAAAPTSAARSSAEFALDGLAFRHEPRAGTSRRARSPGICIRRRRCAGAAAACAAAPSPPTDARMVLPAFGVLAGGLNVLDRAFAPLFAAGSLRAFLIGDGRLFPVAASPALRPD